jgi:hypothetical protein
MGNAYTWPTRPILTYGYQGVLKHGVHPEDHAVAYSSKSKGAEILDREIGLMSKHPIRIEVINDSHKLDPLSRINYAKLYTVEHNVKVFFIGKVAKNYERDVKNAYNEAHPPFDAGPSYHHGSHEDLTGYAQQDEPVYPLTEKPPQEEGGPTYTANPSYPTYPTYPPNPTYSTYPTNPTYPAYDDGYNRD